MIVMKFGGSSVSSKENLENIIKEVNDNIDRKPVIVVSALSGITKRLKDYCYSRKEHLDNRPAKEYYSESEFFKWVTPFYQEIFHYHDDFAKSIGVKLKDPNLNTDLINALTSTDPYFERSRDLVMSFGERFSARIVASLLSSHGIYSEAYDSYKLGFLTDDNFGNARFQINSLNDINTRIRSINSRKVPVITGFIGKDARGNVTTMGPNSSDDTAAILGLALDSEEILVYKTVNGVLTANPGLVKNTKTINHLDYEEAQELAACGSDVMNATAIMLASSNNKVIKVLNLKNPEISTLIDNNYNKSSGDDLVKGIANKDDNVIITIESPFMVDQEGYLARIYDKIAGKHKSLDVITSSGVMVSSTVDPYANDRKRRIEDRDLEEIGNSLSKLGDVRITRNYSIISLVGRVIAAKPLNVLENVCCALNYNEINAKMISLANNSCNLRIVVEQNLENKAVNALHEEFFN